ncbi:MAG: alpha-1,4-glucan--maltose-1-phosphate maltosyltransferase, partial [Candidatus Methylomirabilales bacterium]
PGGLLASLWGERGGAAGDQFESGSGMERLMDNRIKNVAIEVVFPELNAGRFPVKREVGETFEVWADIFQEGHDIIAAVLKYRRRSDSDWQETRMEHTDNDRWRGSFALAENTRYVYTIEAWRDVFQSWRSELNKKVEARLDVGSELLEGRELVRQASARARGEGRNRLTGFVKAMEAARTQPEEIALALAEDLAELMERYPDRRLAKFYDRELEVVVDRPRARYGAWYEMFHRSQGKVPEQSATFKDCEARLPEIKEMGFDVIYLPPIHPIGRTNHKGRNNALVVGPNDPGSPWAIGNEHGGHKAVNQELGTLEDFDRFMKAAAALDIEIALDFAIQCSPDHPYVKDHPEWFYTRSGGSIKYAENPPKKYEDIYPLNFYCDNWPALWEELKSILLFWIGRGVRIFRVDNPHTKPFQFWEWIITEIQEDHPDVIFLAEAFTRPKVMKYLAKAGFSQSYTYFTWRNFKQELIDYFTELAQSEVKEYLRGNFFTNTPDILPPILQTGGRPAFKMRLALAATLGSTYGIYNGYELCENRAIPGKEEYVDSEKYEYKVWDWDRPGNIKDYIAEINKIRRENPALHHFKNLRFYPTDHDSILFYGKMTPVKDNIVFVVVNLDPFSVHEGVVEIPLQEIGIGSDEQFQVRELITGTRYLWKGARQTLRLDPAVEPALVFSVERWQYKDYDTPCF